MTTAPEDFPQLLQAKRFCDLLSSTDRHVRKNALFSLKNLILESRLSCDQNHQIFVTCHTYILNAMRDSSEIVREHGIKCISTIVLKVLPSTDFYLCPLVNAILERLGSAEIIEPTEELRMLLLQTLHDILNAYNEHLLVIFMNEFVAILKQSVKDKYPPCKDISCICISQIAQCMPNQFRPHAASLVQPVLSILKHQHQKIRIAGVRCIGDIIMHSDHPSLNNCVGPLAEKLFDRQSAVRAAVVHVAAKLMMNYRDRYSFFHKLLPLMLTGLHDEVKEVREEAQELWVQVGIQFQIENDKDLKDRLDFLADRPKYYPAELNRPNEGCRVLVQRNISKMVEALCFEMLSWQEDVRVRCSQLLCVIAQYAEESIVVHLPMLLKNMYVAVRDSDERVSENIIRAAEIIAAFAPVNSWTVNILPAVEGCSSFGCIKILACFVRAAPHELIEPVLPKIAQTVCKQNVTHVRNALIHNELRECINAIQTQFTTDMPLEIAQNLFNAIIAVEGNGDDLENTDMLEQLRITMNLNSQCTLWKLFLPKLLENIEFDTHTWNGHYFERGMLQYILLHSGAAFGRNLPAMIAILSKALNEEIDPTSRLTIFIALQSALDDESFIDPQTPETDTFLKTLISELLAPALIWKAGASAEALRTAAASCLASALACGKNCELFQAKESFQPLINEVLPLLISLSDDTNQEIRMLSLENMQLLKQHLVDMELWSAEFLITCYPHVLKRLDDPIEAVRNFTVGVLRVILEGPPDPFLAPVYRNHHEFIIDTLFVHFDDMDEEFRSRVRSALDMMIEINAPLLKEIAEKHKPIVRNQSGCDEILKYLDSLHIN